MRTSFGSLPTTCCLAQLGSALVAASLAINCASDDQIPQPDTGTGLSADSGVRWQTRGQGLSDGSGSEEVFYCDPAGTNARFHWQLEGSGAQPEPDCDGSGANCPTVTNHDADYASTGRLGGCRTFDGAAWIDLGDAANAHGTPGTISLWFKRGDTVAEQFIAGRIEAVEPYRGWMLAFDADNRLSFTLQHDNDTGSGADALIIRTPTAFTDTSAWHHVMVSWSWGPGGALLASDTVFSIDGTPVAAEIVSDTLAGSVDTPAAFTLGARQFDSSGSLVSGSPADFEPDYFTGEIDDVRYFDHALNVAEAASLQGVRLIADPRQCGGCDNACVNGFACVDGACEVPACPGGLQLWMDFEESAGRQVHGRQADTIDAPTRVIYAAIDERHWPDFDPLDSPFVAGPRSGESAFRFNGTVGLTLNNASGDTYALQDHDFAQGLTLSMWVYPESGAAETLLASSIEPTGDEIGWSFGLNATRQLVFLSRDSSTTSVEVHAADSLPLNTWTHVVFTFGYGGPASGRFYVDGAESTLSVDTNTAMSAPSVYVPVVLGGRVGGAETFVGALDRVLVMSAEATAVQVAELADAAQDIDACMPSHQLSCAAGTGSCDGWAVTGCETDLMGEGSGVTGWFECNRCGVFASSCDEGRVVEQLLTENCDTPTDDDGDGQVNCNRSPEGYLPGSISVRTCPSLDVRRRYDDSKNATEPRRVA